MKFQKDDLMTATGGNISSVEALPAENELSFSIDTRTLQPGDVFVALQGRQADGHNYLAQALQKGASGLIVKQQADLPSIEKPVWVLHVHDTLRALQDIARLSRKQHPIPVIGITGSNGKTTVKDMTASILQVKYGHDAVLKSEKSFNNHIGLPLTLANMHERHQVAVLEMGMNAPGEIRRLASIAKPAVGTVTNIAPAHIGFFGSLEYIMYAKMELLESLPRGGHAVLNKDDKLFDRMLSFLRHRGLVTFSIREEDTVVRAERIVQQPDASYTFDMDTILGRIPISLTIPGYHNIYNALAATASVFALFASERMTSLDFIKQGLEQFQPGPMRMQVIKHQGAMIINDAYNANPDSMASAFHTLKTFHGRGKKIAVLGDMFELGALGQQSHYEVGQKAAAAEFDRLYLLGQFAPDVAQGAQESGMSAAHIHIGDSHEHLAELLLSDLKHDDVVLVKASRGMAMEKIVERILRHA